MSKRDEFWDTAPAFEGKYKETCSEVFENVTEGKTEIWVALKAAVDATFKEDIPLAQAILDGAGISLPGGSLCECYDEWGTRYDNINDDDDDNIDNDDQVQYPGVLSVQPTEPGSGQ